MIIKLNFRNEHYICIDILKENKDWFDHFTNNKLQLNSFSFLYKTFESSTQLEEKFQTIKKITKKLKNQGIAIPYELPDNFNYDQQLLNKIHRFFTYTALDVSDKIGNDELLFDVNQLNILVHKLESSTVTPAKTFIENNNFNFKQFLLRSHADEYGEKGWFLAKNENLELQKKYPLEYCTVLMSEEIQGKSYLRAFIDNDDPREIDVTGRLGSYGGFLIDVGNNRKQIYESLEFNQWLESYGLNRMDLLLEWPVGTISTTTQSLDKFNIEDFLNVEFLDPL